MIRAVMTGGRIKLNLIEFNSFIKSVARSYATHAHTQSRNPSPVHNHLNMLWSV